MVPFLPRSVPAKHRRVVSRIYSDVESFAAIHKVQRKSDKKMIPFDPLPMQTRIFNAVRAGHKRILVIKPRQVAATTACKMVLHHMATTTHEEAMFALSSTRGDSADDLLKDNVRWMKHPPVLARRPFKSKSGRLTMVDTKAHLQAFTSRSTTGLRQYSPLAALLSEFAFAPDQEELLAQAISAVGENLLILESTANLPGDRFSELIEGAPENGWHLITMWWWEHPAYCDGQDRWSDGFEESLTEFEVSLQEKYGLSLGQLHWRRRYVASLKQYKFRREYPARLDDCFLGRQGGYFEDEILNDIEIVPFVALGKSMGREIEAPQRNDRYVCGVDVGGGVGEGGDWSTLAIVSVSTGQPVFTKRSNTMTPKQWAHEVIQHASRYHNALVLAESNNHGHALIQELEECRYKNLWRNPRTKKYWTTTLQSKLEAFDTLREALQMIQLMDRATWMELRALTIPQGKVAPEAPKGGHDDLAIAIALAYRCLRDIPPSWRTQALKAGRNRVEAHIAARRARRIRNGYNSPF